MSITFELPQGLQAMRILGCGSFGQVYQCLDAQSSMEYAVKVISKQSLSHSRIRLFYKQAELLSTLHHKNIVKFHSFHQNQSHLFIKMQLIKGSTLKKLIQQRSSSKRPFEQGEIAMFFKHLLEAIRYLHSLNIIHRDLKPDNILFQDDEDLSTVKIVDFGLSAKLEMHNPANIKAQCGTLIYMAPEIFNKPSYSKSVDLWSCAVIMYMLFNEGAHPLYRTGMKPQEFKARLKNQEFPKLNNALAQDFIQKISKKEYEQRYNVNQALKHPWITRNEADQIPLSIHQEYKGFGSTNQIVRMTKLFFVIGNLVVHQKKLIGERYRQKIKDFCERNEVVRECSPSRKKRRDKNNQVFIKMKKMLDRKQESNNSSSQLQSQGKAANLDNHQQFYHYLFQKHINKPAEINYSRISLGPKVESLQQDSFIQLSTLDRKFRQAIEHHIEQYVCEAITQSRQSRGDDKKRIFSKKQIHHPQQPKQLIQRPNVRIVKRLSYESEKQLTNKESDTFINQMVRQKSQLRGVSNQKIVNLTNKKLWK